MQIKIDQIIRSRRRSIAIIVQADGKLVVRAPIRLSNARILEFIHSKTDWILAQQAKIASRRTPVHKFTSGETFLFLGEPIPLEISDNSKQPLILNTSFHLRRSDQPHARDIFIKWYQQQARQVFTNRAQFFAQKYGFNFSKIRLSSARTRWGSCNSKGTLSFSWRLVMAPLEIIDYVIIHELVHLKIQNHSSTFWQKVNEFIPDHKKRRTWLKANGHMLCMGD